jgi:hypothetical protein
MVWVLSNIFIKVMLSKGHLAMAISFQHGLFERLIIARIHAHFSKYISDLARTWL